VLVLDLKISANARITSRLVCDATLVVWSPDYDGTEAIVGGSRIER